MYGTTGTVRRKRMVLAEFIVALAGMTALGIWLVIDASGLGTRILGIWLTGTGLNYAPLVAYAISLRRAGALETELASVDTGQELRRYTALQLWILVPLSLVVMTVQGRKPTSGQLRRLSFFAPASLNSGRRAATRSVRCAGGAARGDPHDQAAQGGQPCDGHPSGVPRAPAT